LVLKERGKPKKEKRGRERAKIVGKITEPVGKRESSPYNLAKWGWGESPHKKRTKQLWSRSEVVDGRRIHEGECTD